MITIGTKRFAEGARGLVASVFEPGGTAAGFYTRRPKGLLFHDLRGAPFAFLVANEPGRCFFVRCAKGENGGPIRYNHGCDERTALALGIAGMGYASELETATRIWAEVTK